jgi:DNA-binding transcriptional regulator YiaG/uncharacterized phage-associated protein
MKSPITGKEMRRMVRKEELVFRKEKFLIQHHFYLCEDSNEEFTDDELDTLNINQVYNQYRHKYNLPFPDEIKSIREQYDLSATKMAEILGFGVNLYRLYESGEVPSISNARLIQAAKDPYEFKKILLSSGVFDGKQLDVIVTKIDKLVCNQSNFFSIGLPQYLMCGLNNGKPSVLTGYVSPNLNKFIELIVFFTEKMQPFKTKMNKLLFYTDFTHYRKTGFGVTGACYKAIQMGPVPKNFDSIFEYAATEDYVDIIYSEFKNDTIGEQFTMSEIHSFDKSLFSESELLIMDFVCEKFRSMQTKEIINISHEERGWLDNQKEKRKISYDYAFDLKHGI